jgi:hypothetical protein
LTRTRQTLADAYRASCWREQRGPVGSLARCWQTLPSDLQAPERGCVRKPRQDLLERTGHATEEYAPVHPGPPPWPRRLGKGRGGAASGSNLHQWCERGDHDFPCGSRLRSAGDSPHRTRRRRRPTSRLRRRVLRLVRPGPADPLRRAGQGRTSVTRGP